MNTFSEPQRSLTIVIPVSHMVVGPGQDYFAAITDQPTGAATPPVTELLPPGTQVIQYQGPDIRGRTADVPTPDANCSSTAERQFLMVLSVAQIRATDLERIPRIGSLSTDPRDLPAIGVAPSVTQVLRNRILQNTVLASPGILGSSSGSSYGSAPTPVPPLDEVECNPIKVIDGNDVVVINGTPVTLQSALGSGDTSTPDANVPSFDYVGAIVFFVGTFGGLLLADIVIKRLCWDIVFDSSNPLFNEWLPSKIWFFLIIALTAGGLNGNGFISQIFNAIGL